MYGSRAASESTHLVSPSGGQAGYTLIELLSVLALLGILTSVAVPRLDVQRYRIEGAMQSVASTLMAAQRRAIQQQHDVVIAFDVDHSRLRVHSDANNNLLIDEGEHVHFEPLGESVRFGRAAVPAFFEGAANVTFSLRQGSLPAVVFSRNGAASEEGGFYLTSLRAMGDAAYGSDTRVLRIDRSTGRPSWFRRRGSAWQQEF